MIEYLDIIKKIENVKANSIMEFNNKVSFPLILSNLNSKIKTLEQDLIIEFGNKESLVITQKDRYAYYEIIYILKKVEKYLYLKIPFKYVDFFEKFKLKNPEFEEENNFNDVKLLEETLNILAILNIKFWCNTDDDKKYYLDNMKDKLKKTYNIDEKIIENDEYDSKEVIKSNSDLIKNNFWIAFLNKIREFLKK